MEQDDVLKTEDYADDILDYERDTRFIAYMKSRLEQAKIDRESDRLIDSDTVFSGIRERFGW
ncbi:MAG: hypothetical protein LBN34_03745 [Clostridiales Family XIII bacterium]|jgi:hypothetical protein|nr:hypothetical protein [Clostridiales Family XIII bacterium]